jgi:lipopolysaccharide/colanic/teichoic acid biosynthesis glycosyltransferase
MFDLNSMDTSAMSSILVADDDQKTRSTLFSVAKRVVDVVGSLLLLPALFTVGLVIFALNPFYNNGPLFFVQSRMGRDCKEFRAYKFRSMRASAAVERSADAPLEKERITPLGGFMRKSRIDELPQIINVLRGEMSLIGPRPDYFDHAVEYLEKIPGYRERHAVRPGISGLAQTELGYIEGLDATRRKVQADLYYITHMSFALEVWIFWRTLRFVARRGGA